MLLGVGPNDREQRAAVKETARAVNLSKVPPHQVELTKIQNTFMLMLKEMKRDVGFDLMPAKTATKEIVGKMLAELTKGQDAPPGLRHAGADHGRHRTYRGWGRA